MKETPGPPFEVPFGSYERPDEEGYRSWRWLTANGTRVILYQGDFPERFFMESIELCDTAGGSTTKSCTQTDDVKEMNDWIDDQIYEGGGLLSDRRDACAFVHYWARECTKHPKMSPRDCMLRVVKRRRTDLPVLFLAAEIVSDFHASTFGIRRMAQEPGRHSAVTLHIIGMSKQIVLPDFVDDDDDELSPL